MTRYSEHVYDDLGGPVTLIMYMYFLLASPAIILPWLTLLIILLCDN